MSADFGKKEIGDLLTRLANENVEYSIKSHYSYNDIIYIFSLAVHLFQKSADGIESVYREDFYYIIRRIHRMIMLFLDSFNVSEVISILKNEQLTDTKGEQISFYTFLKNTILYDDIINETTDNEGNIYPILCTGSFKDLLSVFLTIWKKNKNYLIQTGYPLTVFKGLRILNEMSTNLYPLIIPKDTYNTSYTTSSDIVKCENKMKYNWTDEYSSEKSLVEINDDGNYIYYFSFLDATLIKNPLKIRGLHSNNKDFVKKNRKNIFEFYSLVFEILLDKFNYEKPEDIFEEIFLMNNYEIRVFVKGSPTYRNQEKSFGIFNEMSKLFYFIGCCQKNSPFQNIYSERQHLLRKSTLICEETQLFSIKYKSYIELYKITGYKGLTSFESIDDNISAIFEIEINAKEYWDNYYKILEEKWNKYWQERVGNSISMHFIECPYNGYLQDKINTIITKDIFMLNPKNHTLLKIWKRLDDKGKEKSIVFSTKTNYMFYGKVEFDKEDAYLQWRFIALLLMEENVDFNTMFEHCYGKKIQNNNDKKKLLEVFKAIKNKLRKANINPEIIRYGKNEDEFYFNVNKLINRYK